MKKLTFTVYGNPIALKRPLVARKGFTVDRSSVDKNNFLAKCINHRPNVPLIGPILLRLKFYMKRPQNHFGTGKNRGKLKFSAPEKHVKRPDLDNMVKFVKDALDGVFYVDDSQVYYIEAIKLYTNIDNNAPRVEISIQEAEVK